MSNLQGGYAQLFSCMTISPFQEWIPAMLYGSSFPYVSWQKHLLSLCKKILLKIQNIILVIRRLLVSTEQNSVCANGPFILAKYLVINQLIPSFHLKRQQQEVSIC